MKPTPQWYAVYTRPKWEKKVAELLNRKGIENYCPLNKVVKQWHDRKKLIDEPLFSSYVFVCVSKEELVEVKKTEGIINLVYWLGKPAVIRDSEIEAIRNFLDCYSDIHVERTQVNINDSVQIVQGPLIHKEGVVVEVYRKTVKVLLPTLGFTLAANVDKVHIEVLGAQRTHVRPASMLTIK